MESGCIGYDPKVSSSSLFYNIVWNSNLASIHVCDWICHRAPLTMFSLTTATIIWNVYVWYNLFSIFIESRVSLFRCHTTYVYVYEQKTIISFVLKKYAWCPFKNHDGNGGILDLDGRLMHPRIRLNQIMRSWNKCPHVSLASLKTIFYVN